MPEPLHVLQGGYWKSGNYLLFLVLREILGQNGLYRSFYERSGLAQTIGSLCAAYLNFAEQAEIPMIFRKDDGLVLDCPHPSLRHFTPDVDWVLDESPLVWSHEHPDRLEDWLDRFTHRIFVVRDHPQVINSFVHHHVSAPVRRLVPGYGVDTAEELFARRDVFENYVDQYCAYLASLERHLEGGNSVLVHYTRLVDSKAETTRALADYLELPCDVDRVVERTSFEAVRDHGVEHARAGSADDYKQYFEDWHYEILERCGRWDDLITCARSAPAIRKENP